jgi:adenosine deaminase
MLDLSIDLHLHLDGSLSLSTVKTLAKMQGIDLPEDTEVYKMLSVDEGCRDLSQYLEKFDFPLSLLQTKEAIEEATYLLCRELILEDCIYAEIRFAPQLHTSKGISQEEAVVSAIKGFKRSEMLGGLNSVLYASRRQRERKFCHCGGC